jgi:hypothetical protein
VHRVMAMLRRHSRRTWLLWGLGVVVLLASSLSMLDPVVLTFVVDPELLALFVDSALLYGIIALRGVLPNVRTALRRAWMDEHLLAVVARGHLAVDRVIG